MAIHADPPGRMVPPRVELLSTELPPETTRTAREVHHGDPALHPQRDHPAPAPPITMGADTCPTCAGQGSRKDDLPLRCLMCAKPLREEDRPQRARSAQGRPAPPRVSKPTFIPPGPLSLGQRAMLAAFDLQGSNTTQKDAARRTGVNRAYMNQACMVIRHAPDLATLVVAGVLSLEKAYAVALENKAR